MKPEVLSDIKKTLALTKEQAALKDAYEGYQEYKKILEGINDAKELVKDPELGEFAKEELSSYEEAKIEMEKKIEILLLPKDPNDGKNVILEIRGAAGGDEGNILLSTPTPGAIAFGFLLIMSATILTNGIIDSSIAFC